MDRIEQAIQQLYPSLNHTECAAWLEWALRQSEYSLFTVRDAACVVKVYDSIDPPWQRMALEVVWCGIGRDAVRALHRGMDWARLKGATLFGYSLQHDLSTTRWRKL